MKEFVALLVLLLFYGCESKWDYAVDGEPHVLVINPKHEDGKQ